MSRDDPGGELDELLMTLGDGEPSPDQLRRLMALVKDDPEALETYTDFVLLNCLLSWEGSSAPGDAVGSRGPGRLPPNRDLGGSRVPGRPRRGIRAAGALALAGVLGVFAASRWERRALLPGPERGAAVSAPAAEEALSGGVAVLTRAVGVSWDRAAASPVVGSLLPPGTLRFRSGIIQLEFYSGATVILEGPAEIDLNANDRAFCRLGKLRAVVPTQARGFRIDSPAADLVDLGTEFGMDVGRDRAANVFVFDGKVEIHETDRGRHAVTKSELTEGHGVHIGAEGGLTRIGAEPHTFPSFQELETRGAEEGGRRYRGWLDDRRRLAADPRVVAYFPFEETPGRDRTLAGSGPRTGLDGAIVGCEWVGGRWPGKGALEFRRPSDRVRVSVPGEFAALTLMTWVRVDALPQKLSALMQTDGFDPGEAHWHFNHEGKLSLGVRPGEPDHWTNYVTPPVIGPDRLGRWTHLATVYDVDAGTVTHYVDGDEVSRHEIVDPTPVRIGEAELGNWGSPRSGDLTPVRNLQGRMDEFLLFGAALGAREVAAFYERGRPGS